MIIHLGECPVCEQPLSYEARLCPHCGQPFDKYGSFGDFVVAEQEERERREAEETQRRAKKTFNVILFFVVTLLILVVVILLWYIIQYGSLGSANASSGQGHSTVQTPPPTPTASPAETPIQQYYNDINNRDYQDAANLWYPQTQSLANFQSGYSHTKHDGLVFGDIKTQTDGTIKVFVTVYATELTPSGGTRLSTYKGYYIVGQRGGEWKILNGTLSLA